MLAQGCSTVTDLSVPARPASYDKTVALVLQGGGALGSYQAGVYEALAASEYVPDWVAGISIGAVNAAIIAGNAPESRVRQLRSFWEEVTSRRQTWPLPLAPLAEAERRSSSLAALMFGQPGFFVPRSMLDWISFPNLTSYYNTDSLKSTLEHLVDFDRINAKTMRFSVGAVNVRTGSLTFFDNDTIAIHPEHVMASAALPPGFPAVEIDGEHYWDGGFMGNPPIFPVIYGCDALDIILVHLTPTIRQEVPTTPRAIISRMQEISFNSSLMREMRAVAFMNKLIDDGRMPGGKKMLIHVIEAEDVMSELPVSSKMNGDWGFLSRLHAIGRKRADDWLIANFDRLGAESSVDMLTKYL
jgi:NTE family protein